MMKTQSFIRKDDKVKIITGKDKGKIGKVIKVLQDKNRVMVEKINMVKRHSKPTSQNRQGGIVETEASIHWSNVQIMCNKCMAPVRLEMKRLEDGKKVRACKKCSEIIDA